MIENDTFTLGGHTFSSRFILGSGKYNLDLIRAAVSDAGAQIITLAVRRANTKDSENILDYIPEVSHCFRIRPVPERRRGCPHCAPCTGNGLR